MRIVHFEKAGVPGIAADDGSGWHGLTGHESGFLNYGVTSRKADSKSRCIPKFSRASRPWLVTPDAGPPGAHGLRIQGRLNGRVMQDASTDQLIFSVSALIEMISVAMSLEPGDVIITGTPGGVGVARKPPVFMQPGDVFEVEIEGMGILSNPVQDG
jgi:2-keto-4-pentenoate hydratase/2-oxohepta-3-ene-1,7-dioic acid hydratase in catechol pathway